MKFLSILILTFAASLDSLAIGVLYNSFTSYQLYECIGIIIAVNFLLSILGYFVGTKVGDFFDLKLEIMGGLLLVGVGFKIFCQYIWFK